MIQKLDTTKEFHLNSQFSITLLPDIFVDLICETIKLILEQEVLINFSVVDCPQS